MSQKLQPVRGTHDLLPEESAARAWLIGKARGVAAQYGYGEIATPIFEFTEVFARTLGDASDIVTKEMYTFLDRGGESLTLRPEFTAGIARAFISGGLANQLPLRFFATGPLFRYERPQKGRLRQFHQIDVELLGVAEPEGDVEVIALAAHTLQSIGVLAKTKLEINTLGDSESRAAYREALTNYLQGHVGSLSPESQDRLARNPLRILDSKDPKDKEIVKGAPMLGDHLTSQARDYFARVKEKLSLLGIDFHENPLLVRGLDYYCHTAFEFTTDLLGSQNAVLGGGRYDKLIGEMGGPETPATGWAAGIERLLMLSDADLPKTDIIAIVPFDEAGEKEALMLAQQLRHQGMTVDLAYKGNAGKRMKRASQIGAKTAILLGEDERKQNAVTLRDLATGEQKLVAKDKLFEALKA